MGSLILLCSEIVFSTRHCDYSMILRNIMMANTQSRNISIASRRTLTGRAVFVIEQFEREMKICKNGDQMISKPFCLQKIKGNDGSGNKTNQFTIVVCPNGQNRESAEHISIYLRNMTDNDKTVDCELKVGNRICTFRDTIIKAKSSWGGPKFIKHEEVNDFLDEGSLVVTAAVTMVGDVEIVEGLEDKCRELSPVTNVTRVIFERMENTDFVISCEGVEIHCHKHFLTAASPVFARMLETNMKEAIQGKMEIPYSPTVVKEMVKCIYTGEIEEKVLKKEVMEFLKLGSMYEMENIKIMAENKMIETLGVKNMIEFFIAGDLYKAEGIKDKAKKFLKGKKKYLKKRKDWMEEFGDRKDLAMDLFLNIF